MAKKGQNGIGDGFDHESVNSSVTYVPSSAQSIYEQMFHSTWHFKKSPKHRIKIRIELHGAILRINITIEINQCPAMPGAYISR